MTPVVPKSLVIISTYIIIETHRPEEPPLNDVGMVIVTPQGEKNGKDIGQGWRIRFR